MNESQPRTHCTEPSTQLTPRLLIIFTCLLTYLLLATYSNHFYNSFHFDDSHVIETNSYIQSLKNIPLFFKDASTISSLPTNQQYRPMETVSLAIDYWLSQGLNPLWFKSFRKALFLLLSFICPKTFFSMEESQPLCLA